MAEARVHFPGSLAHGRGVVPVLQVGKLKFKEAHLTQLEASALDPLPDEPHPGPPETHRAGPRLIVMTCDGGGRAGGSGRWKQGGKSHSSGGGS